MNEVIIQSIAIALKVKIEQVENTLKLLEEGNTVPFIARYRKEMTSGLDEEQIREINEAYVYQVNLAKRKEDVKRLIETQGKLTPELVAEIDAAQKLVEVEDIYAPYQQKRKTRASMAINAGLLPLAEQVLQMPDNFAFNEFEAFICDEYASIEAIEQGVKDIIAEKVADDTQIRTRVRKEITDFALLQTKRKKNSVDEKFVYKLYYEHSEKIKEIAPHRVMAIDRGEKEKILTVTIYFDKQIIESVAVRKWAFNKKSNVFGLVKEAIIDGLERLLYPSIEREVRNELSEKAHEQSIGVFSLNLEKLLLQAPMKDKWILGLDPAYRTGCKLAVINEINKVEEISVIYPHQPVNKKQEAEKELLRLLKEYPIQIIAIGNGTASRESEQFVAEVIRKHHLDIQYTIVSEAGASVYSASPLAKEEFPDLSVEQRSAISIARRVADPLSELIKIDPKSIGVGQYQHDLPQKRLNERLDFAVEKAVNKVGVNVNQASATLLEHISGLSKKVAQSIVEYREENGKIKNRVEIKKIPKIGPKTYQQAIGFLRVLESKNPLDMTSIHPESYEVAQKVLDYAEIVDFFALESIEKLKALDVDEVAKSVNSDSYTIKDIINAFETGKRDYRDNYDAPLLKSSITTMEDLKEGEVLEGVVRNVVDFGAFVDIGIKNDGLIHITKFKKRIKHPSQIVSVGDILEVSVYKIDHEKEKVQLEYIKKK